MIKGIKILLIIFVILAFFPVFTEAEDVGLVVRLKGDATILREDRSFKASLKDNIQLEDIAETAERSRLKMLFDDDSLFTLSENSRLIVKEYYLSDDREKFKSVIHLIEGGVRSRVGRTELEIHTPTSVVAARGTSFKVWVDIEDGEPVTNIIAWEGIVEAFNIDPAIKGVEIIEPGTICRVFKSRPPTSSVPIAMPMEILGEAGQAPVIPPIEGQQPANTTPVHIRIPIPEGGL